MPALRSGRAPHEIYLLYLTLLYGLGGLTLGAQPTALEATFPRWGRYLWFAGVVVGSIVAVYGVYRNDIKGLKYERIALNELNVLCFLYIAMATFTSPNAIASALGAAFIIGFVFANGVRVKHITKDLRALPTRQQAEAILNNSNGNNDRQAGL